MPAKPHLGLTQNSSPTTLANERRAAQIAGSRCNAPVARRSGRNTRAAHGAKHPKRPKAPSADGAIPGQGPWSAPPPPRGGRRGPSTIAVPGTVHPRTGANASRRAVQFIVGRGIPDAPTPHPIRGRQGCRPLRRFWSAVQHGGGTHRSRPTFSVGSLSCCRAANPYQCLCDNGIMELFVIFCSLFPPFHSNPKNILVFSPAAGFPSFNLHKFHFFLAAIL